MHSFENFRGSLVKRRIKVRDLMQKDGLRGEIVQLFHSRSTGMIPGDDGCDVSFNEESLVVGIGYTEPNLGVKVSCGIFIATEAKVPTAIKVQPVFSSEKEAEQSRENLVSARRTTLDVV